MSERRQEENTRLKNVIPIVSSTPEPRSQTPVDILKIQDLDKSQYLLIILLYFFLFYLFYFILT